MAQQTNLYNVMYAGPVDLTDYAHKIDLELGVDVKENTTYGSRGFKSKLVALKDSSFGVECYQDMAAAAIDDLLRGTDVGATHVATLAQQSNAAGDVAYIAQGIWEQNTQDSTVGEVAGKDLSWAGNMPAVRGQIAALKAARTTTGTGSVLTMTGPTASQNVYVALHCFAASGTTPSLTVSVKSATLVGFGSPTTRGTFTALTTTGSQLLVIPGAITDGFWRIDWTITGTTPSFTFAATIGVI